MHHWIVTMIEWSLWKIHSSMFCLCDFTLLLFYNFTAFFLLLLSCVPALTSRVHPVHLGVFRAACLDFERFLQRSWTTVVSSTFLLFFFLLLLFSPLCGLQSAGHGALCLLQLNLNDMVFGKWKHAYLHIEWTDRITSGHWRTRLMPGNVRPLTMRSLGADCKTIPKKNQPNQKFLLESSK